MHQFLYCTIWTCEVASFKWNKVNVKLWQYIFYLESCPDIKISRCQDYLASPTPAVEMLSAWTPDLSSLPDFPYRLPALKNSVKTILKWQGKILWFPWNNTAWDDKSPDISMLTLEIVRYFKHQLKFLSLESKMIFPETFPVVHCCWWRNSNTSDWIALKECDTIYCLDQPRILMMK